MNQNECILDAVFINEKEMWIWTAPFVCQHSREYYKSLLFCKVEFFWMSCPLGLRVIFIHTFNIIIFFFLFTLSFFFAEKLCYWCTVFFFDTVLVLVTCFFSLSFFSFCLFLLLSTPSKILAKVIMKRLLPLTQ